MSDYFSRLAEKALGAAPLVRPVIAPVFSPERGVSGSFIEATGWVDTDLPKPDVPNLVADGSGKPLQAASPDLPVPETLRKELPILLSAAEPPTSVPSQPATSPPPSPPMQKPERVRALIEQRQVTGDVLTTPPTTETAQILQALDTPTEPDRLDRQVILVPVPGQGGNEGDYASRPRETEAEFDRSLDLKPYQQFSESQSLIRPEITSPRRQRVSPAPQTGEWLEAPEEAGLKTHLIPTGKEAEMPVEPTIRVTIGRVDVRLVQPPATAKPSSTRTTTPPILSLDEYLKKRGEGRQ